MTLATLESEVQALRKELDEMRKLLQTGTLSEPYTGIVPASNMDPFFVGILSILKTLGQARGDLMVWTAAGEPQRLPVGMPEQVLTVDPTAPLGMVWATPHKGPGIPTDGADGQVLVADSTDPDTVRWGTLTVSA